jgi:glycosyl transferase family 41
MGVPVITWPQSRVVSRQTYAFLSLIGLPELAARDADDYVNIATRLANDSQRLGELRATLRERMAKSPLCDVVGFTRGFEDSLYRLFDEVELSSQNGENTAATHDYQEMEQLAMSDDQKITIDNKDYALSEMSQEARDQLQNIQVTDQELQRLQMQLAIAQTARAAYAQALKNALDGKGAENS